MNKKIRNKYVVLFTGIVIAVVSAIMAPVSANNNSIQLNTDCMTNVNGIMIAVKCDKPIEKVKQIPHSELKDHC